MSKETAAEAPRARVLQLNAAGSNALMHAVLNDPLNNTDIVCFQDPYWGPIGYHPSTNPSDPRPHHTVAAQQWHCLVPITPNNPQGPGVAIYFRRGRKWLSGSISMAYKPTTSTIAVDFRIYGYHLRIVNTYLRGDFAKEGLTDLTETPLDPLFPTIFVRDYNMHHELWAHEDYSIASTPKDTAHFAEWLIANNIEIMNRKNVITRRGRTGQRNSIIDLIMVNHAAWNDEIVTDWECEKEKSFGSDHNGIMFDIIPPPNTRYHPPTTEWRYTIDASRKDDWLTAFNEEMKSRPVPQVFGTEEDCQIGALRILQAMVAATQKVMPKSRANGCPPRAAWWNEDCSLTLREVKDNTDEALDICYSLCNYLLSVCASEWT